MVIVLFQVSNIFRLLKHIRVFVDLDAPHITIWQSDEDHIARLNRRLPGIKVGL